MKSTLVLVSLASFFFLQVICTNNLKNVVYWGQDSSNNPAELPLKSYCADSTYDIIVVAFVYDFPTTSGSSYPAMDLANHCSDSFSGNPKLLNCPSVGSDIEYCQSQGKIILMSFGGADGTYGFTSDAQAQTFATTVWNMFLGGTSTMRPFGTAILDGIDLDIESGKSTGYGAFVNALRTYFVGASKPYYVSAAPQCVYPDEWLGPGTGMAFTTAWFDFIWIQFYNNYCGLDAYPSQFNYQTWANYVSSTSLNKNVKLFIGAPGSSKAAGTGYVSISQLTTISNAVALSNPNTYGGVMLWDASVAALNANFGTAVKNMLNGISIVSTPSPVTNGKLTTSTKPIVPITSNKPIIVSSITSSKHSITSGSLTTGIIKDDSSTSSSSSHNTHSSTSSSSSSSSSHHSTSTSSSSSSSHSTSSSSSSSNPPSHSSSSSSSNPIVGSSAASAISGSSCDTIGFMQCLTSETYSTCDHNKWSVSQSCAPGTNCSPSGNYIYCI